METTNKQVKTMKRYLICCFLFVGTVLCAQTPAFPGAYGGGMYTTGGRGGKVLYVTSLEDGETSDVGTFRWAVSQKYPRTVVFKVSGIIHLKRKLSIKSGDLTIAGQSAPGDGICIADYEVTLDADNIIVRYMRFRPGQSDLGTESDAINGRGLRNIILDHCSMSWSIDECASFYDNKDFTMQWCFVVESLCNSGHSKGAHGYGGIWGGENASFHHNLIANHLSRAPRFNGWKRAGLRYRATIAEERVDFRNNVVFNWGDNSSYGGESAGHYNIVANYFKPGMGTASSKRDRITRVDMDKNRADSVPPGHGFYYIAENYVHGADKPEGADWSYVSLKDGVKRKNCYSATPFDYTPVLQHAAKDVLMSVATYGGACFVRDAVDLRIAQELITGVSRFKGSVSGRAGLIDRVEDVGGYPEYNSAEAPADSNDDGIPDGWLEQNYPGKTANDLNEEGYTYLEVYLNGLVEQITIAQYAGAKLN